VTSPWAIFVLKNKTQVEASNLWAPLTTGSIFPSIVRGEKSIARESLKVKCFLMSNFTVFDTVQYRPDASRNGHSGGAPVRGNKKKQCSEPVYPVQVYSLKNPPKNNTVYTATTRVTTIYTMSIIDTLQVKS